MAIAALIILGLLSALLAIGGMQSERAGGVIEPKPKVPRPSKYPDGRERPSYTTPTPPKKD